jgi:hypothetical protein
MPWRVISMSGWESEVIEFTQLDGLRSGFDRGGHPWADYRRWLLRG